MVLLQKSLPSGGLLLLLISLHTLKKIIFSLEKVNKPQQFPLLGKISSLSFFCQHAPDWLTPLAFALFTLKNKPLLFDLVFHF